MSPGTLKTLEKVSRKTRTPSLCHQWQRLKETSDFQSFSMVMYKESTKLKI